MGLPLFADPLRLVFGCRAIHSVLYRSSDREIASKHLAKGLELVTASGEAVCQANVAQILGWFATAVVIRDHSGLYMADARLVVSRSGQNNLPRK